MNDESALLAAIIAHADEDTPRLVYADWLDENGDPDRATFIRVQCRLADLSPGDPDWVDLREQQEELLVRLKTHRMGRGLSKAKRFYFSDIGIDDLNPPYRRGFPYSIDYQSDRSQLKPKGHAGMLAELTRLVKETTIRGFHPYQLTLGWFKELLTAPVMSQLTCLSLRPVGEPGEQQEGVAFHRLIATSPALAGVRELGLYGKLAEGSVAALAEAKTLSAVRRLTIQQMDSSATTAEKFMRAAWLRHVQHFRADLPQEETAIAAVTGLSELPDLHTLDLSENTPAAVAKLAAGKFPALQRLSYSGPLGAVAARTLAGAKFSGLAVFEGYSDWRDTLNGPGLRELLKAEWFGRLRVLDLSQNNIDDDGIKALAAHPVAKGLRILNLSGNRFGKRGLTALAKRGAFPVLTTLILGSGTDTYNRRNNKAADLAAFLTALQMPRLRHLDLAGWPLGNAGAKALATNPDLAGLTLLDLESCFIGDPGAKAIFASPHLRNLVELKIHSNSIKNGADALADPAVMPQLSECSLYHNKIPPATTKKLKRKRRVLVV